jgi:hypothetical protein
VVHAASLPRWSMPCPEGAVPSPGDRAGSGAAATSGAPCTPRVASVRVGVFAAVSGEWGEARSHPAEVGKTRTQP